MTAICFIFLSAWIAYFCSNFLISLGNKQSQALFQMGNLFGKKQQSNPKRRKEHEMTEQETAILVRFSFVLLLTVALGFPFYLAISNLDKGLT